jgi:hypothetical protein
LGLLPAVPARKTEWRAISIGEANAFFEMHHLHKFTQAYFASGLFFEGQLVAAISFRQHAEGEGTEIARFCTKTDLRTNGGFQKLLKNSLPFLRDRTLITYADRDWCPKAEDSVYYKSGFKIVGDSGPKLFYYDFKNNKMHSRQAFQAHKLKDLFPQFYSEDLKADDILGLAKIRPLWTSGNWKFKLEI